MRAHLLVQPIHEDILDHLPDLCSISEIFDHLKALELKGVAKADELHEEDLVTAFCSHMKDL